MEGTIVNENDEGVAVDVVDNAGITHETTVEKESWEIVYHVQDGYPDDPDERTWTEMRHVSQARNYAKYYVYRERGYDALAEGENPDRLALTALVVAALPEDRLRAQFGDLYRQLESHYGGSERPLSLPAGCGPQNPTIYLQDLYLGLGAVDTATVAEAMADGAVVELLEDVPALTDRGQGRGFTDLPAIAAIARAHGLTDDEGTPRPLAEWLEATSELHLKWRTMEGNQFEMGDHPNIGREYDARLQVVPFDPEDVAEFRNSLVWNLKCQIRDQYIACGVTPPTGVRVTGPGDDGRTVTYMKYDAMQNYHNPNATVEWSVEDWPERGENGGDDDDDGLLGLF